MGVDREINLQMICAVRGGELERVTQLIDQYGLGYSPSGWAGGYILLKDAFRNKRAEVAKLLLRRGAKILNSKNELAITFNRAAEIGDIELLDVMLARGCNINGKDETPLCYSKTKEVTEYLLKHGVNVNTVNRCGISPLHEAIKLGCLQTVHNLIKYGADIHAVVSSSLRYSSYTPLHFTAKYGKEEIITLLVNKGANVDAKAENNITPLHVAVERHHRRIIEALLDNGASVSSMTSREGYTPLHLASKYYYKDNVKLLLSRGADIHARSNNNSTALHIAAQNQNQSVLEYLLQNGARVDDIDKDGKTALYLAVEREHFRMVENILQYHPDINIESNKASLNTAILGSDTFDSKKIVIAMLDYGMNVSPEDVYNTELFHSAIEKGFSKIVKDLLEYGANISLSNKSGSPPLNIAVKNAHAEVAKLLISYGANVKDVFELLKTAVENGSIEIVRQLLEYDFDINACDKNGKTVLDFIVTENYTCYSDNKDVVKKSKGPITKLLLDKGANVNYQTRDGMTILHLASENGYAEVVQVLLEYNVNVNSTAKMLYTTNVTPLHLCAEKGYKSIVIMLLDKGANVNAKNSDGMTALHFAVRYSHEEVVKILLEHDAEVNSANRSGTTSLHLGASQRDEKIIEILLKYGADIDFKDKDGITALHKASRNLHEKAFKILLAYGADVNIASKDNATIYDHAQAGIKYYNSLPLDEDDEYYSEDDEYSDNDGAQQQVNCPGKLLIEELERHVIKMKTANLFVSTNILESINISKMPSFQAECIKEIEGMKNERINNSSISFYDFLEKFKASAAIYRNEDVVQALESDKCETQFPIYASMIKCYYMKGMQRRKLVEQSIKIFHKFEKLPKLPHICVDKIISYLEEKDLKILISICSSDTKNNLTHNINMMKIT